VIGVVLVGGFGTRLRPLTNQTPKAMLPVANRPFLEHQLEHLASHGIDRVILACGYRPDALRAHFGDRVQYVVEDEPLGTAGAIAHATRGVEETFVACNGDVLTDLDVTALVGLHRDRRARLTLALHAVDDPSRYGVVETAADGAVTRFVEKPPPGAAGADTINAGTYVIEPEVLADVPPGRAVSIEQEVFPTLIGRGLYAQVQAGRWIDIGTPESYLAANVQLAPPEGLVDPSARVEPGVRIARSVVGPGAHVGAGASVSGSVLLPGAVVPDGRIVENRVIDGSEPVW
jgi:NDP-sugar pyrophosphorylase family protein